MRWAFVNAGGALVPDLAKARRYGITRLYWEARDPLLSGGLLDAIAAKGFEVGILRDPSWTSASPVGLAIALDADLTRLGRGAGVQCAALADIEFPHHDPAYILGFLAAWRRRRPWRDTHWTPEFHQGGWFSPELVAAIDADLNFAVFPQAYIDDPPIVQDADLARADITARGVDKRRVGVFYLPGDVLHRESWDGIVFGLAELP